MDCRASAVESLLGGKAVFTFGRDHEKKCAVAKLRKSDQAAILVGVVDAVHDLLEGKSSLDDMRPTLTNAFASGGTGVWESTGSWMRKIMGEHPTFATVWRELATHSEGQVRFRAACFINDLPKPLAIELGNELKEDRHKKTREMAQARLEEIGT
jgi:hypothetical protein